DRDVMLIAKNHLLFELHSAEATVKIVMQVGAADAAGFDPHLDFAGPKRRRHHWLNAKVLRRVKHSGTHGHSPKFILAYTLPTRAPSEGNPMNMFDLTGRLALVTGSSRGIGRAIAEGYVAAGARVIINGRDAAAVAATVKAIGANA